MEGQVFSAMRLLTECGCGGILDPTNEAHGKNGPLGISVFDILQEKHPRQQPIDPSVFIDCGMLPLLEQVDITAAHIQKVARCLFGNAGPLPLVSSSGEPFCSTMEQSVHAYMRWLLHPIIVMLMRSSLGMTWERFITMWYHSWQTTQSVPHRNWRVQTADWDQSNASCNRPWCAESVWLRPTMCWSKSQGWSCSSCYEETVWDRWLRRHIIGLRIQCIQFTKYASYTMEIAGCSGHDIPFF